MKERERERERGKHLQTYSFCNNVLQDIFERIKMIQNHVCDHLQFIRASQPIKDSSWYVNSK